MTKILLLLATTFLLGCSPDKYEDLSRNIEKWRQAKPNAYTFVGKFSCPHCLGETDGAFLVTVVGESYEVHDLESGDLYKKDEADRNWFIGPVDHIYQGILVLLREEPGTVGSAEYDRNYGYPVRIQIYANSLHPVDFSISQFRIDDGA